MTPLKLLEETVSYYSADASRRASDDTGCFYHKEGKMCAVGRCIKKPLNKEGELEGVFSHIARLDEQLTNTEKQTLFKKKYQNIPFSVWSEIQELHDGEIYWTNNGLSPLGITRVETLRRAYQNPETIY